MLSIKKIQDIRANKKQKGFSFMEILVALIMIVSLSVGAFFTYSDAQQTHKLAQMNNDMDAIVTGVWVYEALNINSSLPSSLTDLAKLEAANSVDGCDHENIVTSVKFTTTGEKTGFIDPWGNAYSYSKDDRTLKCTPVKTDGKTQMSEVVRHF